jgi:hypothetical protein
MSRQVSGNFRDDVSDILDLRFREGFAEIRERANLQTLSRPFQGAFFWTLLPGPSAERLSPGLFLATLWVAHVRKFI